MALSCPQCGGGNVSERGGSLALSLAVFVILMASWRVAGPYLGPILLVATPISFFCLLVTGAMAIAGSRRCRDCGCPVRVGSAGTAETADQPFPTGVSVLCMVILFVAVVVGRPLILGLAGIVWWGLVLETFMVLVLWAICAGLLLIGQAVAFRMLESWVRGARAWAVLFLVPTVALAGGGVWWSLQTAAAFRHSEQPQVKAGMILEEGKAGPSPAIRHRDPRPRLVVSLLRGIVSELPCQPGGYRRVPRDLAEPAGSGGRGLHAAANAAARVPPPQRGGLVHGGPEHLLLERPWDARVVQPGDSRAGTRVRHSARGPSQLGRGDRKRANGDLSDGFETQGGPGIVHGLRGRRISSPGRTRSLRLAGCSLRPNCEG